MGGGACQRLGGAGLGLDVRGTEVGEAAQRREGWHGCGSSGGKWTWSKGVKVGDALRDVGEEGQVQSHGGGGVRKAVGEVTSWAVQGWGHGDKAVVWPPLRRQKASVDPHSPGPLWGALLLQGSAGPSISASILCSC